METFIKVYIKSEDDLPKEDDYYFVYDNNYQNPFQVHRWLKGSERYWIEHIDWYLKPVEIPEITDEEIQKYVNSFPDNPNHLLLDATINSTFVEGAKWYRNELKKRLK